MTGRNSKFVWFFFFFFFKPRFLRMLFFGRPAKISQECLIQSTWNFQAFLFTLSSIQWVKKIRVVLILTKDNIRIHPYKRTPSVIVISLVTPKIFDLLCTKCVSIIVYHCTLTVLNQIIISLSFIVLEKFLPVYVNKT